MNYTLLANVTRQRYWSNGSDLGQAWLNNDNDYYVELEVRYGSRYVDYTVVQWQLDVFRFLRYAPPLILS